MNMKSATKSVISYSIIPKKKKSEEFKFCTSKSNANK